MPRFPRVHYLEIPKRRYQSGYFGVVSALGRRVSLCRMKHDRAWAIVRGTRRLRARERNDEGASCPRYVSVRTESSHSPPLTTPFLLFSHSLSLSLALDLRNTIRSVSVLLRLRIGRRENVRPGRLSVRSDIRSRDCEQIIPCIQFVQRGE